MIYLKTYENFQIFNLKDLAKMLTNNFINDKNYNDYYKLFLIELNKAYKYYGDDKVIDIFQQGAGFTLTPLGQGKYYVK